MTTTTMGPVSLSSRTQLKNYCLRRLGAPVINIEVDDEQVEDRIQDAIQYFQTYHADGIERTFLEATIVPSTLAITTPTVLNFNSQDVLTGLTSGATAIAYFGTSPYISGNDKFYLTPVTKGTFQDGETIQGSISGTTAIVATSGFVLGNWDKKYLTFDDDTITSITKIYSLGQGGQQDTNSIFSIVYQMRLEDLTQGNAGGLLTADLGYYTSMKHYLSLLDQVLPSERTIRFNRYNGKLNIDINWGEEFIPGNIVLAEAYVLIDPEVANAMYDDYFIKRYATLLIKKQWATNLIKYKDMKLPGAVLFDATEMYQKAEDELEKLETEMIDSWAGPIQIFVG